MFRWLKCKWIAAQQQLIEGRIEHNNININSKEQEFLLVVRSNVGKSSFINTIIGRKNYAHTSSKPGKTQTLKSSINDKSKLELWAIKTKSPINSINFGNTSSIVGASLTILYAKQLYDAIEQVMPKLIQAFINVYGKSHADYIRDRLQNIVHQQGDDYWRWGKGF